MYRFKLKEIEVGDTEIRGGKKSTVSAIDDTTGRIEWDIVDAADFSSVYKALLKAKDFLSTLEKEGKAKDDVVIDGFAEDIAKLFNAFRTHVRKAYPKEYERVSRLKESVNESKGAKNYFDDLIFNYQKAFRYLKSDEKKEYQQLVKSYFSRLKEDLEVDVELRPTREKLKVTIPGDFDDNEGEYTVTKELKSQNKEYKDFRIKDIKLKEEEVEEGEGIGYLTPNAFGKKKKNVYTSQYGYKLVPKKIKGSGIIVKQLFEKTDRNEFQAKRIAAFKEVEERLNRIYPLLDNAKDETAKYYNENPGSYAVVYSTDYIFELLDEIEAKLNI